MERNAVKIERGWLIVIATLIVFGVLGAVDFIHKDTTPPPVPDPSLNMNH